MMRYAVVIERAAGNYSAYVPDLPGCVATGETVATFVRASTRVPWFTGFFSNTVSAVSSTAASEGITAIAPVARAVSPER